MTRCRCCASCCSRRSKRWSGPIVWLYTPMALPLVAELDARSIVYDCMDELSAFRFAPRQLQQREAGSAETRRRRVHRWAQPVPMRSRNRHANVLCIPSAVDAVAFRAATAMAGPMAGRCASAPRLFRRDRRAHRPAVARSAGAGAPAWQIFMVGPVLQGSTRTTLPRRGPIFTGSASRPSTRCRAWLRSGTLPDAVCTQRSHALHQPDQDTRVHGGGQADRQHQCARRRGLLSATVRVARGTGDSSRPAMRRWRSRSRNRGAPSGDDRPRRRPILGRGRRLDGTGGVRAGTGVRSMRITRISCMGAGPTGLAAALGLSRDTLLVEREERIGGLCRSIVANGYTFDHAGHVMASQDPYVLACTSACWVRTYTGRTARPGSSRGGAYTRAPDATREPFRLSVARRFPGTHGRFPAVAARRIAHRGGGGGHRRPRALPDAVDR